MNQHKKHRNRNRRNWNFFIQRDVVDLKQKALPFLFSN